MEPIPLKDTQSERDCRRIPIDRVGVKNLRYPIQIRDKAHSLQSTIATITLTVDLPHHFKGTHMSRFLEALNAHGRILHVDNIGCILDQLLNRLDSEEAHAEFEFPFFLEKKAPSTGSPGIMDYLVRFHAMKGPGKQDFILTVIVNLTTLCPCSKAISASGAHNQRGQVTLSVRSLQPIWIEDLIRLVESCGSSELYSVLKRPDEKFVTERAYENPVFVEDLVREIAAKLNGDDNVTAYRIEAENFESIHNHNAYALVEKNWRHTL
jgi:GTP cyclohydrolase I